jgi:2-polyprenyl-6-methoxyphenol hydroxylase-like FAD-dependent oxidoreductase
MTVDVVVAGAGPVGLMLGCELRLAGVRPVVLERRAEPGEIPKANGLGGQIVQMLDYRGLLDRFTAEAPFAGPFPSFPFGSVKLDFSKLDFSPLDGGPPLGVMIQQPRMEALLAGRAGELGAEIRRGHELTGLSQDDGAVTLDVRGPDGDYRLRARYLVGCDGAHSRVRELAGIAFPGTTDDEVLRLGHFRAPGHTSVFAPPEMEVPGVGRLQPGWNRTPHGRVLVTSLGPGVQVAGVREEDTSTFDPATAMTIEEFQAGVRRVLGVDLPLGEPIWLSRVITESRLAERYRAGRVLLAGDAAHLFPAGGALNVGMMDAVNLGWKLAAQVRGRAPGGLLDSYHAERRPVGARNQVQTRAQAALDRASGENGAALRELLTELFALEQPLRRLMAILHGSENRYDMPGGAPEPHRLLGRFAPDLRVDTKQGSTRVAELMRAAAPLLLDLAGREDVRETAEGWTDRISIVTARCDDAPADALLIRPDGYVAWVGTAAGREGPAHAGLGEALSAWFGAAASPIMTR